MQESTGRSRDMFLSDGEAVCVSTSQKSHQTIWLYSTKPESKGEEAHIEDDCCFVC